MSNRSLGTSLIPVALLVIAIAASILAARATGSQESLAESQVCRDAIASAKIDPTESKEATELVALEEAEQERWRRIRSVTREIKKLSRGTIGMGNSDQSLKKIGQIKELYEKLDREILDAWFLCRCREGRDDPHRENCEELYDRKLSRRQKERLSNP